MLVGDWSSYVCSSGVYFMIFFFKQKTAYDCCPRDWISYVALPIYCLGMRRSAICPQNFLLVPMCLHSHRNLPTARSEERRDGNERRSRWSPYH